MRARSSISQAQASGDVAGVGAVSSACAPAWRQLFAVAQKTYPQLKSDATFRALGVGASRRWGVHCRRRELYNDRST